ncbi:MAG: RsmD family RNA methyltransferase [Tetrasphaera sp.]
MTRIIGGSAGGRRLRAPRGQATRPTSDRVREALFSRLEAHDALAGARVLDAYAGSGALGLEAASRGAAAVVCVESDRGAAAVIGANARELGLAAQVQVRATTVARFAAAAGDRAAAAGGSAAGDGVAAGDGPAEAAYDLVLGDPPYPMSEADLARDLAALAAAGVLADGALVVLERSSRSPVPAWPSGWSTQDSRRYGETTLWFARAAAQAAC